MKPLTRHAYNITPWPQASMYKDNLFVNGNIIPFDVLDIFLKLRLIDLYREEKGAYKIHYQRVLETFLTSPEMGLL